MQANQGQLPHCAQEHWPEDGSGKAGIALQCRPPRAHSRNDHCCHGGCRSYKAFEATITANYDAQSAVERELILRLASLLWRLRRATVMETGLFEISSQAICAIITTTG